MAQKINSVALTYVPGVAINQHRTGGIVFRFVPGRAQALVTALEATIDAIIRAVNGTPDTEEVDDTQPAIPIPKHPIPVGPAQRPQPIPQTPQNGMPTITGALTIEQARAVALELAGKRETPHNPHRQPTTVRRNSDEARAMQHAQSGGEAPIIQRRRTAPQEAQPVIEGGQGPNIRRTKQPPVVTVQNGQLVTGQRLRATGAKVEAAAVEAEPIAIDTPAPIVQEGFTPDDTEDYGPPPEHIGQA